MMALSSQDYVKQVKDVADRSNEKLNTEIKKLNDSMKYLIENIEIKNKDEGQPQIHRQLLMYIDIQT